MQSIIEGTDGSFLPGTFFSHYLKEFDHAIKRFQVIQDERGAIRFCIVKGGRYSDEVLEEVLATFRRYLGEGMRIDVEFVENVALVRTGKRLSSVSGLKRDFQRETPPSSFARSSARERPGSEADVSVRAHRVVTISRPGLSYVDAPPFDPPNPVYEAVEALWRRLGLDLARAGSPEWNPLGDLIAPGDRVVVKPNLVSSRNLHQRDRRSKARSVEHPWLFACLRPILDYALKATGGRGQVRVVDTPVEGCELEKVAGPLGIFAVIEHLRSRGHDVEFVDLRHFRVAPLFALDDVRRAGRSWNLGLLVRKRLSGDPLGYRVVDLGRESFFSRPDSPPPSALRFHRSHYRTPLAQHTEAAPRLLPSGDRVLPRRRGDQHPQAEDTQEDGRDAVSQERHRSLQ